MPAPRQPIEIREFARPDLPPGAALLRTARSEVCGTDVHLWHGRLAGVPYPIIPGHVSAGVLESIRGPLAGLDGSTLREGDRAVFFDVHRTCGQCRACTVHRTPTRCSSRRVYGITDSAARGLVWRLVAVHLPRARRRRCAPARRGQRGRLHRRRLRTADGRSHPRARVASSRRQRARSGCGRGRAVRHRALPARRCLDGVRRRRSRASADARAADGRRRGVRAWLDERRRRGCRRSATARTERASMS